MIFRCSHLGTNPIKSSSWLINKTIGLMKCWYWKAHSEFTNPVKYKNIKFDNVLTVSLLVFFCLQLVLAHFQNIKFCGVQERQFGLAAANKGSQFIFLLQKSLHPEGLNEGAFIETFYHLEIGCCYIIIYLFQSLGCYVQLFLYLVLHPHILFLLCLSTVTFNRQIYLF